MLIRPFEISGKTEALFVGPPLEKGPLPTLLYFALSAKDSLQSHPFNQPVRHLKDLPLRIFSVTLPGHENSPPPGNVLSIWEQRMKKGDPVIPRFIDSVREIADRLQPHILEKRLAVAGLSRGAYIACHVAAVCPTVSTILGFAPLTRFDVARDLDLETLISQLYTKAIRFYIGNHDTRVGTEHTFSFISKLAAEAHKNGIRSCPIELLIGPSIGYKGHGTSAEVFQAGTEWIKRALLNG
ncbi:MAG: hypothetical protein AAGE99_05215 [Chlamydiota bacterium]